jgi:hypothetical protein
LHDFSRGAEHHGRFSYLTTRAVAAGQVLPFSAVLLSEQGRVIFCLTKALDCDPGQYGLKPSRGFSYELPGGFGRRVLTVLERAVVASA